MRNASRFIPGEEIDAVAQWRFGRMDGAELGLDDDDEAALKAKELARQEVEKQAAYAEGFEQGRAQTLLDAQRQVREYIAQQGQEMAQQMAELMVQMQAQLDQAQEIAARGVLELACELARQVLRHEIATNPNALLPVVRESLAALFLDSKNVVVRLHPQDLDMLQEALQQEFPALAVAVLADANVARGGCLVEAAGTEVDGSMETRWQRAIAQLGLQLPWKGGDDAE